MKTWGCFLLVMLAVVPGGFAQDLPTCAVMTFEATGGVSADDARVLSDRFEVEFGRLGQYALFPRANIGKVIDLQKYNLTCAGSECAMELGQLLTVQYTVFGSIGKVGSVYTVNASMVDVGTGKVEKQCSYDHRGEVEDLLQWGMASAASKLLELEETRPVVHAPPVPGKDASSEGRSWASSKGWMITGGAVALVGGGIYFLTNDDDKEKETTSGSSSSSSSSSSGQGTTGSISVEVMSASDGDRVSVWLNGAYLGDSNSSGSFSWSGRVNRGANDLDIYPTFASNGVIDFCVRKNGATVDCVSSFGYARYDYTLNF